MTRGELLEAPELNRYNKRGDRYRRALVPSEARGSGAFYCGERERFGQNLDFASAYNARNDGRNNGIHLYCNRETGV